MKQITVLGDGRRLDALLSGEACSRSQAARQIREGLVRVSGKVVDKPSFIPKTGEEVVFTPQKAREIDIKAENLPISILYEDEELALVHKPCGLVVHPAASNEAGTLVNALLYHLKDLSGIGGQKRPGIVHRLDKDTSGLMLVAKTDQAHLALSRDLALRRVDKYYLALVDGRLKEERGHFDGPIGRSQRDRKKMAVLPGGRAALTHYQVLEQRDKSALVLIHLITGRTHQIRVHFATAQHPVLGDPIYGHRNTAPAPRLMLHAAALAFEHPKTGQALRFFAPAEASFAAPGEQEIWAAIKRF